MSVHPIPKPTRADRKRSAIETFDLVYPKAHFLRDGDYRAWVRTHRCVLPAYDKACQGAVQAAHLEHGGRGIKGSDASCVPLCERHHGTLDGETLPWQFVAFLWVKAWALREEWHRRNP
jgi:hypothetical protein